MAQRVLITAGASGIGSEIARAFAATGARVFVCDIDADALTSFATALPGALTTRCDVADRRDVEDMVAAGAAALGGLDVLVNNAGIAGPTDPVEAMDPDEWEKVVAVNLNGTFNVTRCAIPHLRRSAAGVIINMSSVAGRLGYPNRSPYATTKWGLIGFTKTLSMELGEFGIRVNAILPGAVAGPRLDRVYDARARVGGRSVEEIKTRALANQSLKTFVDPRDVAALAVFLASDAAKSISGQALPIDGDRQQTT
ncbi:MAG: SDR family oxidoreductase [Xanthobacteraceae bacterium]|nr:SDR family oxidoreductase [Xanthobacteraceae bacterium]